MRDRLAENGWGGIPIRAHDDGSKGAGKAPTLRGWQRFAAFEAEMPTAAERRLWERREGPGTGIPCGSVVGVDIDVRDPALVAEIVAIATRVFGETPFVRQGSAPKLCLVYRAAAAIPKRAFKANDQSGDGLDIMGAGSQFVAFGVHPRTCRPYEWLGAETPLTAPPSAAPSITAAQVADFVERVRAILPLSKTGGRRRGPGGDDAEIRRDGEGFVTDGRELWLTRVVWRAVTDLASAGEILADAAIVAKAWPEFQRTARVEVGGRIWTEEHCAEKARGTLDRIRRKAVKLPPRPVAVAATYPDDALPLAAAEAEVAHLVAEFFERDAPTFKGARTLYEIKHRTNPIALPPVPQGVALRIEAGIGKTEAAIQAIAPALRRGLAVVYAVPTVELGDAIASRFAALGVEARVWRGRDQPDPDAPGERMCRDLQAVADARRAGVHSIAGAVCSKKRKGGKPLQCRYFAECAHVRQKLAEPPIWIVTHGMLFAGKPGAIPQPDALVIDESFAGKAVPDKASALAVDAIERGGLPEDFKAALSLQRNRRALVEALRQAADGPLTRASLGAAGVTAEAAREARKIEWSRFVDPAIVPGQAPQDREERVEASADVNLEVKHLAGLWAELADFLEGDFAASGRLSVGQDRSGARTIRRRSLKVVHDDWRCPTLMLDATAPPAHILTVALGLPVEMRASIRAQWHGTARVRQVVGGPQTSNALGANGQGCGTRSLADLARFVALRAALVFPAKIGVVLQKNLVKPFEAHGLGHNVEVRHFGALAGLDHWREFGGVILIGRTAPAPGSMEADAGVLTGEPMELSKEPFATGGILLRDGSVAGAPMIRLADPIAEALRWQVCEGNLIQAIGRIRPLRAGARASFFVDILCDLPLPIVVDEVRRWEAVKPSPWAEMAAEGVIFTSVADVMAARPDLAPTEDRARWLLGGKSTSGTTSKERVISDVTPDRAFPPKRILMKRKGREQTEAFILPNGPRGRQAQRRFLEERLGPFESFAVEGERRAAADLGEAVTIRLGTAGGGLSAAYRIAGRVALSLAETGFDAAMMQAIRGHGEKGATRDDLLRCALRPTSAQRDASLDRLRQARWISEVEERGRGRPSKRFKIATDDEECLDG